MGNTIEASFGLDLAPLKRGFQQAEQVARDGAQRVARAARVAWDPMAGLVSNPFTGGAPQSRSLRNTAASRGGFLPPARPGQYLPIADDSPPENGSRGFRNVANRLLSLRSIGAVYIAQRLGRALTDQGDANSDFDRKIVSGASPLGGGSAFNTSEDIEAKIKAATDAQDAFFERDSHERHGIYGAALRARRQGVAQLNGEGTPAEQDAKDAVKKRELNNQIADSIGKLTQKQIDLNSVESEKLHISDRQAELDKAELEHNEKLGKIAAIRGNTRNLTAAENERFRLQKEAINLPYDLADETLAIRKRVQRGELSPAQARLAGLLAKRRSVNDRDAQDVDADIYEERFAQNQIDNSETGYNFSYHNAERRAHRERMAFAAREDDRKDRAARGAKYDSSNQSQTASASAIAILTDIKSGIEQLVGEWH